MNGRDILTGFCGAKTRAGSPCKRARNFTGRCHLHGGKSLFGISHPNYRHGAYSKYRSLGLILIAMRKKRCMVIKSNGERCRQWAMIADGFQRCVAHQHMELAFTDKQIKLLMSGWYNRERKQ
jgi:hypothetical protein